MNKIQLTNLILIVIIIILSTALAVIEKRPIIAQMNKWKLLPEPETFTELYFNDHLNLPSTVKVNTPQEFSFVIHNEEYQTMSYPYEIYIASPSGKNIFIDRHSVTLKQDQYKTIKEKFSVPTPVKREEVVVNLTNLNQQIDFWIGVTK